MMMLAHEDDPDPATRPSPIFEDRREEIIAQMIAGLTRDPRSLRASAASGLAHAAINAGIALGALSATFLLGRGARDRSHIADQ